MLSIQKCLPRTCLSKWKSLASVVISRRNASLDVSGVFTPIITPFNSDETIADDKLKENFSKWNSTDLRGYLVQGSNGEVVLLSPEERVQLVAKVRQLVPANKLLLAGAGCESTQGTVEMTRRMADAGADAVMLVTPHYYKASLTDRALIHHFSVVADQSPVPVLLYSVPANTGIDLSVAAITALSAHDNIVAVKDSGGDITKLAAIVHATKHQDFQVLAGSAGYLLSALHLGCVGGVCALANVAPELVCQLYQMFQGPDADSRSELMQLQHRLIGPNSAVTKIHGVAGLKQAMDWCGYYGGPTRKPIMSLLPDATDNLRKIFVEAKLLSE